MRARSAILFLLPFGFIVVGAVGYASPSGPRDLIVLGNRLDVFYSKNDPRSGNYDELTKGNLNGLAVVEVVLRYVLAQPTDGGGFVRRRNVELLAWATELVWSREKNSPVDLKRKVYLHLANLLRRHPGATESRGYVVAMFDALGLWSARELPFLGRAAGRSDVLAMQFAERARPIVVSDETDEVDVARMVSAIRRTKTLSHQQYLLLLRSGYATAEDRVRVLYDVMVRFTEARPEQMTELLASGSPERALIEFLMDEYADAQPVMHVVLAKVSRMSEVRGGTIWALHRRRTFLANVAKNEVFERPEQRLRMNAAAAPARPPTKRILDFTTEGNVLHVNFLCEDLFVR